MKEPPLASLQWIHLAAQAKALSNAAIPCLLVAMAMFFGPLSGQSAAQSLPRHFEYVEKRLFTNGNICVTTFEVTVLGSAVLQAPTSRKCSTETGEYSGEEGKVYQFDSPGPITRSCQIDAGVEPKARCSDGETVTMFGLESKEPLRTVATLNRTARFEDGRLTLEVHDNETRYTLQGGSGKRPMKIRVDYTIVFSFAGNGCKIDRIRISRVVNGRNQSFLQSLPVSCKLLR